MTLPLVSVVIPCYNHAQFIEAAIKSVLAQTYENIQLIVIDDGSIDDSLQIINQIAREHSICVVEQTNQGICKTLNRAIKEFSHGEYIALLASDDYWDPSKLKKQMNILELNPRSEFCFTQAMKFDSDKKLRAEKVFPRKALTGRVTKHVFLRQHVPAGSMVFSRRLFDLLNGFDETLREEDWDFVIRCSANTEFSAIQEPLFFYRSHSANTMKTRDRKEIFRQKALILSKNFHLVTPMRWFVAVSLHFIYDIFLADFLKEK
ncbi:glycosyltransferase family 2 protein [Paralcaligenes ginsengisoli]